jgi:excisionase family DNA binding protein
LKGRKAMIKKYLSVEETCEFLGIKRTKLYKLKNEGGLPYIKLGGSLKFDVEDLIKWMDSLKETDK